MSELMLLYGHPVGPEYATEFQKVREYGTEFQKSGNFVV